MMKKLICLATAVLLGLSLNAHGVTARVGVNLIENGNFDVDPTWSQFSSNIVLTAWEDGMVYGDSVAGTNVTVAKTLSYRTNVFVSNSARTRFFGLITGGKAGPVSGLYTDYYYSGLDTAPVSQTVTVTNDAALKALIDSGTGEFQASGYFGGWDGQEDRVDLHITFLRAGEAAGDLTLGGVSAADREEARDAFVWRFETGIVPPDIDQILFTLKTRTFTGSNSGTADALSFVILPGVPAPPVTDGLQVHLTADSGIGSRIDKTEVTTWIDRQNGHVFTGSGATYSAANEGELPAVDFTRSSGSGFTGDFSSTAGGMIGDATVFVVARFNGYSHASGASSYFFSIDSTTGGSEHTLGRDENASDPDALYHYRGQPAPQAVYGENITEPAGGRFVQYTSIFRGSEDPVLDEMAAWIGGSEGGTRPPDLAHNGSGYEADPARIRIGNWTGGESGLDGRIREVLIFNRVLGEGEIRQVEAYLAGRTAPRPPTTTYYVRLSGRNRPEADLLVPNGDPEVRGFAKLVFDPEKPNNTLASYEIRLSNNRYRVAAAHVYNLGRRDYGDSWVCWGGRWNDGYDSLGFLKGVDFYYSRFATLTADQFDATSTNDWYLIVHTEGGHFATDGEGKLIPYDPNTDVEPSTRFNARVGRKLDSVVLRDRNTKYTSTQSVDEFDQYNPGPNEIQNTNNLPFPDANGIIWVEPDGAGGWSLTDAAVTNGYSLETNYLFYLYDDQGPSWDYGGPEGGMIGRLNGDPADAFLFYEEWVREAYPLTSADSRREADPDDDGWANRFEQVFGTRPNVADPPADFFTTSRTNIAGTEHLQLVFPLSKFHGTGTVQVSRSTDLVTWNRFWREDRLAMADAPGFHAEDLGGRWRIELTDPIGVSEAFFYRFEVIE